MHGRTDNKGVAWVVIQLHLVFWIFLTNLQDLKTREILSHYDRKYNIKNGMHIMLGKEIGDKQSLGYVCSGYLDGIKTSSKLMAATSTQLLETSHNRHL